MMLERAVVIGRPVGEVYAFVAEPRNLPRWQTTVSEVRRDDGEVEVGTRFTEIRHFAGRRFESTIEITELELDRLFTVRVVRGPMPLTVRHVFEPQGEGTALTVQGEAKPAGVLRLAAGAMARAAARETGRDLRRLAELLE